MNKDFLIYVMIPINGEKLALVKDKPENGLRYKTVSCNGYWLIKTSEVHEDVEYSSQDLIEIRKFIRRLWWRGYRKTMEQLVRATKDKRLVEGFYKSTSLENFMKINLEGESELVERLPEDLYQKRRYSVYKLCQWLVGKKVNINTELIGEYNRISFGPKISKDEDWVEVNSLVFNQTRANISLLLSNGASRCIIRDGVLNMKYLGVQGSEVPKELKKISIMNIVSNDEFLLDLSKLPITSRSDFGRKLTSFQLCKAIAELEYAKLARRQFSEKKTRKHIGKKKEEKQHYSYQATSLDIRVSFFPSTGIKLMGDQGKDWNIEYKKCREKKSKLIFELFSKKLFGFQEPGKPRVEGYGKKLIVGPEKILIKVKLGIFLDKKIKL